MEKSSSLIESIDWSRSKTKIRRRKFLEDWAGAAVGMRLKVEAIFKEIDEKKLKKSSTEIMSRA